jgi:hypothetical protein
LGRLPEGPVILETEPLVLAGLQPSAPPGVIVIFVLPPVAAVELQTYETVPTPPTTVAELEPLTVSEAVGTGLTTKLLGGTRVKVSTCDCVAPVESVPNTVTVTVVAVVNGLGTTIGISPVSAALAAEQTSIPPKIKQNASKYLNDFCFVILKFYYYPSKLL